MGLNFRFLEFFYPLSIARLRLLFERSQWFSPEGFADLQTFLLRRTIDYAFRHVPYYRDLFAQYRLKAEDIRSVSDLRLLPTLSKETLRRQYHRLKAETANKNKAHEYRTSGTTGEPVRFLLDKSANVLEFVYYWRHWSWAGYRLGQRFAELNTTEFLVDQKKASRSYIYRAAMGRLLLNSLSLSTDKVKAHAALLRRYRPLFLKGTASVLYFMSLYLRELGITDLVLRGVFSTGEVLLPYQRQIIQETFGCKVYDSYGHMERTVAASECPSGGFHINPEYGVLELEDRVPVPQADVDTTASSGQRFSAKVLGTSLHNLSMPLLRYETGDIVDFTEPGKPCPCGRMMPLINRVDGRRDDVIVTSDGCVITALFTVFSKVFGISLGQAVQREPDHLVVRIVRAPSYNSESEFHLVRYIRHFVGSTMRLSFEYPLMEELRPAPGVKFRPIVSNIDSGTAEHLTSVPFGVG
jgi:phenylacetate-CoA ligase